MGGNLAKLRAILDLARTLQSSFSIDEVLISVVDTALAITGAERGFLMLRPEGGLETKVARDASGHHLRESDLRVPRHVIQRALQNRRELLSMNFDPAERRRNEAPEQHRRSGTAQRDLRAAGAHPRRPGRCDQHPHDRQ